MHCEICGGQIEIQANGKGMCTTCGTTYSIEYLRKLLCNSPTQSNRISPTNSNDFEIVAGTLIIYHGNSRRVIIPEGVVEIADAAFSNMTYLESIQLPTTLLSIGQYAFSGCKSLVNISIPTKVTSIGSSAFSNCKSLQKIILPNSITTLGSHVFHLCTNLKEITFSNNLKVIPMSAFESCESLVNVTIPEKVDLIEKNAFMYCYSLKNLTISSTVKTIEDGAFAWCKNLREVHLPDSIDISNYDHPFTGCEKLKKVSYPSHLSPQIFFQTPWYENKSRELIQNGICPYCEGRLSIFGKKCKTCGKSY